jgi:hypothetical protein
VKADFDGPFRQQLLSLYSISIEIAMVHELPPVLDRALGYCLDLTDSQFGFVGLLDSTKHMMDVAASRGLNPRTLASTTGSERFRFARTSSERSSAKAAALCQTTSSTIPAAWASRMAIPLCALTWVFR